MAGKGIARAAENMRPVIAGNEAKTW